MKHNSQPDYLFFSVTKQGWPSTWHWGAGVAAGEGFVSDLLPIVLLHHFQLQNPYVSAMKQFQILNCLSAWQLTSLIEQNSARIIDLYIITELETFQGVFFYVTRLC